MIRLGLVGHPVAHSRSAEVHRTFGEQLGLTVDYQLHDVAPRLLAAQLAVLADQGVVGVNVTLPHKLAVIEQLADLSDRARRASAVNTIRFSDMSGDNTDGEGLLTDLEDNLQIAIAGARILVLGASGAAMGTVASLIPRAPDSITVANRDDGRAQRLIDALPTARRCAYAALDLSAFDLILNATSASLRDEVPPLPEQRFRGAAYDLVAMGRETAFQHWAMAAGARMAAEGRGMLIEQAALSWAFWGLPTPDPKPLLKPDQVLRG